jgi:dephospho-CoA kinase
MKLAIIGKMCSGKSYISDYLIKEYNFKRYSFGEPVKRYSKEIFNYKGKNRNIMINFGQKMREINPDVWINYLVNKLPKHDKSCVVDDVRFINEYERLKKLGFKFIRLEIELNFQIERIKKTYPENYLNHINKLNDVSESLDPNLEVEYVFKVNKDSENDVYLFIDELISNY